MLLTNPTQILGIVMFFVKIRDQDVRAFSLIITSCIQKPVAKTLGCSQVGAVVKYKVKPSI